MLHYLHPFVISRYEKRVHSQNGEDGVLDYLLSKIEHNRTFFEVGFTIDNDGYPECNTAWLMAHDYWKGTAVDSCYYAESKERVNDTRFYKYLANDIALPNDVAPLYSFTHLMLKHRVPTDLGVLSIDIDGNDYWLWKSMDEQVKPAIVIIEYNAHIPNNCHRLAQPFQEEDEGWDGSDFFGANAVAMRALGYAKGYELVYICHHLNMFFVRKDLLPSDFNRPNDGYDLDYGPILRHPTYTGDKKYVQV